MLTQKQIATIEAHLTKATHKHPDFCRNVTEKRLPQIRTELAFIRQENDLRENHDEEFLERLIEEEVLEMCEAPTSRATRTLKSRSATTASYCYCAVRSSWKRRAADAKD